MNTFNRLSALSFDLYPAVRQFHSTANITPTDTIRHCTQTLNDINRDRRELQNTVHAQPESLDNAEKTTQGILEKAIHKYVRQTSQISPKLHEIHDKLCNIDFRQYESGSSNDEGWREERRELCLAFAHELLGASCPTSRE